MSDPRLIEAVKAGAYAEMEELIKNGADVNQQDEQGWTLLSFAAGKGDLPMVRLLIDNGADVFKVGRDRRTPYMIALAAGRKAVVTYLREIESTYPGEKPSRQLSKYCKAHPLGKLREYSGWSESRINWKVAGEKIGEDRQRQLTDEKIVFIHQDFTVTESIWHDENVIFNQVTPAWEEFCADSLKFKIPDDLDLITPSDTV